MSARTPGVHERGAVFVDDDLVRAQPAPVFAARTERVDVLDESPAGGSPSTRLAIGRRLALAAAPLHQLGVVVEGALPPRSSDRSSANAAKGRRRHVAELVRAGSSPRGCRAALRPVRRRASPRPRAASADRALPRTPAPRSKTSPVWTNTVVPPAHCRLRIDQTGGLQNVHELIERAVDVADGDDRGPAAVARSGAAPPARAAPVKTSASQNGHRRIGSTRPSRGS